MTGVFAQWQPHYAAYGVATFPVEDKRPCVTHWQRIGLPASRQLALKFADADAFGFQCGPRSRITIIDIDSKDECIVGEAESYGQGSWQVRFFPVCANSGGRCLSKYRSLQDRAAG